MAEGSKGSKTAQKEFVRVSPEEYASSLNDSSMEELIPDHIDAPVIMNGIHLRQKDESTPFAFFTYCPAPFMTTPVRVDWKILTPEAIVSQHICYYKLKPEDNLGDVLGRCNPQHTKAIFLVNCDDGYSLPQSVLQGEFPQPAFPVCILSSHEGQQMLGMVESHEVGDLLTKVESSSMSDSLAKSSKSPSPDELSLSLQNVSKHRKLRIPFHKPRVDLKKKLKEIMTSPTGGVMCVSEDQAMFQRVMEEFNNYEQAAQTKLHSQSDNSRVFQKLIKFINQDIVFNKDYPFYLILACRVFRKQQVYACEEHPLYIRRCITKFEELAQRNQLDPLLGFIQRGDFYVHYESDQASTSVFQLMEKAGQLLLKESLKMKGRSGSGSQPHRALLFKMIWLSVSLKFKSEKGLRDGSKVWQDYLTKDPTCYSMDSHTIKDLVFGLELGQALSLPVESSFGMQQMVQLLVGTQFVRPFYQLSEFLGAVEPFLFVPEDFVNHFVSSLRVPYRLCLQPGCKRLSDLSTVQNLLGAIQEGLSFLDKVYEIWQSKHWDHPLFDHEMLEWISVLLKAVDISNEKATSYLKEFVTPAAHSVTSKYKKFIEKTIVADTRSNFGKMDVHKFSWLYKSFYIWDLPVVEDFLRSYHFPTGGGRLNIKEKVWVDFFSEIVQRFAGAQNHGFILEFLILVGDHYREERKAKQFIFDLLSMQISGLFVVEQSTNKDHAAQSVPITFQAFLREYIQRNHLTISVISHVTTIWKSITQMSEFQLLVLTVLQKELIPEARSLQAPIKESIHKILSDTIGLLSYDTSWLTDLTAHHKFAFGVVAVCCSRLPLSEQLHWMSSYTQVVALLGKIYTAYCHHQGIEEDSTILSELPADVREVRLEDMHRYFQWVIDVQAVLLLWKRKFTEQNLTFDLMLDYLHLGTHVMDVGKSLCSESLVVDSSVMEASKSQYLRLFEKLNYHLVKYIPGHPEAGWVLLPDILREYGIEIPDNISTILSEQVVFPRGEEVMYVTHLMVNPIEPSATDLFKPGHDVALSLTNDMTLVQLASLVTSLDKLLTPMKEHLELLVYFHLHHSAIFDTYLRFQLRQNLLTVPMEGQLSLRERVGSMSLSLFGSLKKGEPFQEAFRGIPWEVLQESLKETNQLVLKIVRGNACYSDITAGDTLLLDSMDTDAEFRVFTDYTRQMNISVEDFDGLHGIQCMLELFQYTHLINTIYNVCEQYHLEGCLKDERLIGIKEIADDLLTEGRRDQLTSKEATEMMNKIITALCLKKNSNCIKQPLRLFSAVADSIMFYQFVKDKEFFGEEGQDMFRQQYELITAQLQHEEYNEMVLNHLFTAFRIILPFLDDEQDFESLMMAVNAINITSGQQELSTVNKNIHMVKLWFSRAEEDSLETVPAELECILHSGEYQFVFSHTSMGIKAELFLDYQPPSLAPPPLSTSQFLQDVPDGVAEVSDLTLSRRDSAPSDAHNRTLNKRETMSPPPPPRTQQLNSRQIKDFEQRLGFLDPEDNIMENIKRFLMLNRNAYKLLEQFQRLRDLGQPSYIALPLVSPNPHDQPQVPLIPFRVLSCSLTEDEVLKKVEEVEQELNMWSLEVEDLHSTYENLLFFTIPKLLHVHRHMINGNMEGIVDQISFLFKNNIIIREKLKSNVKNLLPQVKDLVGSCAAPMEVVGSFMLKLFEEYEMARYALRIRHPYRQISRTLSAQANTVLHCCHGFTTSQLMSLIINIYEGVPESFLLLRCHPTTTEDELKLFLKRTSKHAFKFMIISVERLPYQLQELLLQFQLKQKPGLSDSEGSSCLHFVETGPSVLREMPWILMKDHKDGISLNQEKAKKLCQQAMVSQEDFQCISLVYGYPGDGKSHYINSKLSKKLPHMMLHIPINEAFTPLSAITKLRKLATDTRGCCLYFNFTILPPSDSCQQKEKDQYRELMNTVNWFLFELLVLGYVEDPTSGASFRLPGGLVWAVYIEVPSRGRQVEPKESLRKFFEDVPILELVAKPEFIDPRRPYVVDEDVQLVCKYLRAYKTKNGKNGINKLFKEPKKNRPVEPVKFSLEKDMSADECHSLLNEFIPPHMKKNKTTQKLFVRYMKRRCHFLDTLPAYNYNLGASEHITNSKGQKVSNNTRHLGSTLMASFLREVEEFCDPDAQADWSKKPHQQLLYDVVDGGASIGLISLRSEHMSSDERKRFVEIGIELPALTEMHSREVLDSYLSRALGAPLDNNRLKLIDDSGYVLTLDYTLKMLNIHERHECGMPVIIEGETGVGKTALVEMLSKLWNYSHLWQWNQVRDTLLDTMSRKMDELSDVNAERLQGCIDVVTSLRTGEPVTDEDLLKVAELPDARSPSALFHSVLLEEALKLKDNPVLSLLDRPEPASKNTFNHLFRAAEYRNNAKTTTELLYSIFVAQVKHTFHKLNVHAALRTTDVIEFFSEVIDEAYNIRDAYATCKDTTLMTRIPAVTVFLDEVNTASCLGLFKEIIVDKSIDGKPLPDNVFVIAACNPHRGDSLAAMAQDETWIRSSYFVRELHPTLDFLKWDYGALDEYQERDYIHAKLRLIEQEMSNSRLASLAELIVSSQNHMRAFAYDQLHSLGVQEREAALCSRSSVSQRDIQRVFKFYEWFLMIQNKFKPCGPDEDYHRSAMMLALAMVYYMRLDAKYRKKLSDIMDRSSLLSGGTSFTDNLDREINWYVDQMDIPRGIAKTQALKENVFANIVCTMTHTPLIIVGPPGCSKTLSFNLVTANLRGQESKMKLFRDTTLFQSLDPHYYQCSRRTTSNEVHTVFLRAINRQRTYAKVPLPVYCVVFMDEAGLPEESLESLKVLHYHLDRKEVSFVAISNHMLDAAKTNRAVSVYRPEASVDELRTLVKGCLCDDPEHPPAEVKRDIDIITKFCPIYHKFMSKPEFRKFYGLRDFIHFVNYLRRNRKKGINDRLVMQALERNFNGSPQFEGICREFLQMINSSLSKVPKRSILDILRASLSDKPLDGEEDEVRYKLIIDSSEDSSLLRLLFAFEVLKYENTRTYVCSDFPGDSHQNMINTVAAIRHSAAAGHTVLLSQTDEIHESFYDLFNKRFRRIDDPKAGPRYYSNIAIGAHYKPCRVHPDFQCIVVVRQSEIDNIPPPFLNRFEKYSLTHKSLLEAVMNTLPAYLRAVVQRAQEKTVEFVEQVEANKSLYGFHKDTLDSLVLSLLPPVGYKEFLETDDKPQDDDEEEDTRENDVILLDTLLRALRKRAGFRLPHFTPEELADDARYVTNLVTRDSQFAGRFSVLTKPDILQAVPEALEGLYHIHAGGTKMTARADLSINACMVISVFLQWLVRHLAKRLIQLMTMEAVTSHYRTLPLAYTETYLQHQSHFHLKTLIEKQIQVLELDDQIDRSTTGTASHLLCFTRSSALIHQFPARYPSPGTLQLSCDYESLIKRVIFSHHQQVMILKMSNVTSQATVKETLRAFMKSRYDRVLLIVVNMAETTPEMVSHLRVLIEEADTGEKLKLFVTLLHFPLDMFAAHCYPTLFTNTWDHHYLDVVGQNSTGQVMDICEWFAHCCKFLSSKSYSQEQHVSMRLSYLLQEALPIISSRVFFGKNPNAPFNHHMAIPQRKQALQDLFDKGVGEILCDKFLKYWDPGVMLEYLEKAGSLTTANQVTTLSITDSVQLLIKDTFSDYVVYMVSKMNEDMNIDILFDPQCSESTRQLFLALLKASPSPRLSQLKTLSSFANCLCVEEGEGESYTPKFPFFRLVASIMDKIIEQNRKELNQRLTTTIDTLQTNPEMTLADFSLRVLPKVIEDKTHLVTIMKEHVDWVLKNHLQSEEEGVLKVALTAMMSNSELYRKYSEAFTHKKLRLANTSAGLSFRILKLAFMQLNSDDNILNRFSLLHICIHVFQLDLARLVQVMRPLDTLLSLTQDIPDDPFAAVTSPSPTASFLKSVQESGIVLGQPGDMSSYVLKILFSALLGTMFGDDPEGSAVQKNLCLWYTVYHDVMSMSTVQEYLYKNVTELAETQHHIMHATFLLIRCTPQSSIDVISNAQKVFKTLFNQHLTEQMELKSDCPRIAEVAETLVHVLTEATVNQAIQQDDPCLQQLFEGLFSHFFSIYRSNYHRQDCQWFLELVNDNLDLSSQSSVSLEGEGSEGSDSESTGCISVGVYKVYLTRILGSTEMSDGSTVSCPALYKQSIRALVGNVLTAACPEEEPQPYIPLFYRDCPSLQKIPSAESILMQQPLAHLYFVMALEHIESNGHNIADLVRAADALQKGVEDDDLTKEERVLKEIEKQALIQGVMQQLAKHLDPTNSLGVNAVTTIVPDINHLLNDQTMGGGYGLTLSMLLLKETKSYSLFSELLGAKYESYHRDFDCLSAVTLDMQLMEECYLFPFLVNVGKGSILKDLYERVHRAMMTAHASQGKKTGPLTSVAEEWSRGRVVIGLPDGHDVQGERSLLFKMVLWLVTYYRFYCAKKTSPVLVELLSGQLSNVIENPKLRHLVSCFLDPSLMIRAQTTDDGTTDPVYLLFNQEDDALLRHALASLIAVVISSPPTNTHLWYNMFSADQLANTLMPGYLYETLVGQDDLYYNDGTQLTDTGFYSQMSYIKHATRGNLSLQSTYLLLWASYGAFCVGLLVDDKAEENMCGHVFPEGFAVREHCVTQLHAMWGHLSSSLGISSEERSYLVSRCMWNLLKTASGSSNQFRGGKFQAMAQLNNYESIWHTGVFLPVWTTLKEEFSKFAAVYKNEVLDNIRSLQAHYPVFTTVDSLQLALLANPYISSYQENSEYVLAQFALQYQQLELGGAMLPELVEFYQWIHQELGHVITHEDASKITLRRAVRVLAKSYSPEEGDRLIGLYNRLKEMYGQYTAMMGHSLAQLDDSTLLLDVLSYTSENDQPLDLLYAVISDIINTHNSFVMKVVMKVKSDEDSPISSYLNSDQLPKVHPTEFTRQNCIVEQPISIHGLTDYVQMIRSRSALYPTHSVTTEDAAPLRTGGWDIVHSNLPGQKGHLINLQQLQEDVILTHIMGKPMIKPPTTLRMHFSFRDNNPRAKENLSAIEADLETVSENLVEEFKYPMDDTTTKSLEMHFHSATYQVVMEAISGLRSVAGQLIKKTMGSDRSVLEQLAEETVASFLSRVLEVDHLPHSTSVLQEIGIHSLSSSQFSILEHLKLPYLYKALGWLVKWVSEGWCEFYSIPYSMKTALSEPDIEALKAIPDSYTAAQGKLLSDLKALVGVLAHIESTSQLSTQANKNPQMSIVNLLSTMGQCQDQDELLQLIPDTVTIQHYVALRVALKQLITSLKRQLSSESLSMRTQLWDDFISDLWTTKLTQFRRDNYTYAVVSTGNRRKRVYSLRNIDRGDEALLNDLMAAGVSESDLLPDTDVDTDDASLGRPDSTPLSPSSSFGADSYLEDKSSPKRESKLKRLASRYSCEALCDFLEQIGMEEYVQNFQDFSVSGDILLSAGQDLNDLGIENALHCLKISILFQRQLEGLSKVAKKFPVEEVVRFLHSVKLSEHVASFQEQEIDGEFLLAASEKVLEVLGVKNHIQRLSIKKRFADYVTPRSTTL